MGWRDERECDLGNAQSSGCEDETETRESEARQRLGEEAAERLESSSASCSSGDVGDSRKEKE